MAELSPTPTHPGAVLRERVLPSLGLSVSRASRELGISRQTLHRVLAGKASVTPEMAVRLARLTGVVSHFWLDLQQTHDVVRVEIELADVIPRIPAHTLPPSLANELFTHGR